MLEKLEKGRCILLYIYIYIYMLHVLEDIYMVKEFEFCLLMETVGIMA